MIFNNVDTGKKDSYKYNIKYRRICDITMHISELYQNHWGNITPNFICKDRKKYQMGQINKNKGGGTLTFSRR